MTHHRRKRADGGPIADGNEANLPWRRRRVRSETMDNLTDPRNMATPWTTPMGWGPSWLSTLTAFGVESARDAMKQGRQRADGGPVEVERPRSPVPPWLLESWDTIREGREDDKSVAPNPISFLGDVGSMGAELTGVPSIVRGVGNLTDESGDALTKAKGAGEVALGAMPGAAMTRIGAPLVNAATKTVPRAVGTMLGLSAPGAISDARADSATAQSKIADSRPPEYMTKELDGLRAQKAAKQAEFNAMNQKHAKSGPETQRQALDPLRADLRALDGKITEAEDRIRTFMADVTEKARQELPFRERHPGAAQAITAGAAGLGAALPFAGAVKNRIGNFVDSLMMRRGAANAERAFAANEPEKFTELRRSLGRQADRLDKEAGFTHGHALPLAKAIPLSALMQFEASSIPEQVDAMAFPPGHPTRDAARGEFTKGDYYTSRILPSILTGVATAGLGHELGVLATPRARVPESARNVINRGSQESIDDLQKLARYRRAVEDAKGANLAGRDVGLAGRDVQRLEGEASGLARPVSSGTAGGPAQSARPPTSGQTEPESAPRPGLAGATFPNQAASPTVPVFPGTETPLPPGVALNSRGLPYNEYTGHPLKKQLYTKKPSKPGSKKGSHDDVGFWRGGAVRAYTDGGTIGGGTGLLHSDVPGRTDHLPLSVQEDSFVIPADTVSALGQGNTLAGSRELDRMLGGSPQDPRAFADGGEVPILAAGGEYMVSPEAVARLGGGDIDQGHRILKALVEQVRAGAIKKLRSIPGPSAD